MNEKQPTHFKGKEAIAHVIEARSKGKGFMYQEHGSVLSSPYSAAFTLAKETAVLFSFLGLAFHLLKWPETFPFFISFFLSYLIYKTGKTAILGWTRLERLHRMIEEERYEIEHHRPQEKEELSALYKAKGFSGKLLEEVIDILMADDNRLLQVMLEEEFGLELEKLEHPLKQALGAFLGCSITTILSLITLFFFAPYSLFVLTVFVIITTSFIAGKKEKRQKLPNIVWNLALYSLSFATLYYALQIFL